MISLRNIQHHYGQRVALNGIDLEVAENEFLGIIGPNSAGKSTLLKIMGGDLAPTQGSIEMAGKPMDQWGFNDLARRMAVVSSEEFFVFPFIAEEIVWMGRSPYIGRWSRPSERDREVVREAMDATDVWSLRHRPIDRLSSGERQRVLLARCLAQEPKVLLLDEPTAHLDIGHEWGFFRLLRKLHNERSLTIVCILHNLLLAAGFCDRLLLLHEGNIAAIGTAPEVLAQQRLSHVFGPDVPASLLPAIMTSYEQQLNKGLA